MKQVLIDHATLEKALKLAFILGQTYWQQADSDYVSQQNKSNGTREKFNQLITDTCAALTKAELVEDAERYRWLREQTWTMGGLVVTDVANVRLGAMCPADSLLDQTIDAAIAKGAK